MYASFIFKEKTRIYHWVFFFNYLSDKMKGEKLWL